jgi:hypothetical protein
MWLEICASASVVLVAVAYYLCDGPPKMDLKGKRCIVTGGSSGEQV